MQSHHELSQITNPNPQVVSSLVDSILAVGKADLFTGTPPYTEASEQIQHLIQTLPELEHLIGDSVLMSPEARGGIDPNQELLRTSGGLAVLSTLLQMAHGTSSSDKEEAYKSFVREQKVNTLSIETLQRLSDSFTAMLKQVEAKVESNPSPAFAQEQGLLLCALVDIYSDLGKNKDIIKSLIDPTGDHDIDFRRVLREATDEELTSMLPSSQLLVPQLRPLLRSALLVSFNFGHIMQGETCPAALNPLLKEEPWMRQFVLHHHLRDIAGARSHVVPSGSDIFVEQKVQDILVFLDAAYTAQDASSLFNSFYDRKQFPVEIENALEQAPDAEQRAFKLLALTLRVEEYPERIKPLITAWGALSPIEKSTLIKHHERTGDDASAPFFVITYRPGFLDNLCKGYIEQDGDDLTRPVHYGLRVLSKIFSTAEKLSLQDMELRTLEQPVITVVGREFAKKGADRFIDTLFAHSEIPVAKINVEFGAVPSNGNIILS